MSVSAAGVGVVSGAEVLGELRRCGDGDGSGRLESARVRLSSFSVGSGSVIVSRVCR